MSSEKELCGECLIYIAACYAEVLADDIPKRARELRFAAIRKLQKYLITYQNNGYDQRLIDAIAKKKCEMISTITSKSEMDLLIKPRCPYFDGNRFIPDKFMVPEEELICWSETSLRAPLRSEAFERYMELFGQVYPKESKEIFEGAV